MTQLKQFPMFESVSEKTLDTMWHMGKVVHYEKNQYCFRAKEENKYIFISLSGKMAVFNLTHTGKRKTIFFLGPGKLLNDYIDRGRYPAVSCQAIESCMVFVISTSLFLQCMEQDFSLTRAVIGALEQKMWRMEHQLKNTMGSIHLERKLAAKLWKLGRDFGTFDEKGMYIDIPLSITELADLLGAPRETTSRICKLLTSYGLISIERKRIYVLSQEKLAAFYKRGELPE